MVIHETKQRVFRVTASEDREYVILTLFVLKADEWKIRELRLTRDEFRLLQGIEATAL